MHTPVLCHEVLEGLKLSEQGAYLDGTVGFGGHTEAILTRALGSHVVALDRDHSALKLVEKRLKRFLKSRLTLVAGNFKDLNSLKQEFPVQQFDGVLLDLGVSSMQFDDRKRGFSFQKEGPLDMRMDLSLEVKAADMVNHYSEDKLAAIFKEYGEERYARPIAKAIVKRRKEKPFETTLDLANLILVLTPLWTSRRIHPATRVFQALRIAVNQELLGLAEALKDCFQLLKPKGRLLVISFHSLEDRIVKRTFQTFEHPCVCPSDFPVCACGKKPLGHRVTKKPIVPSEKEILLNPRSRSAKLRIIERMAIL